MYFEVLENKERNNFFIFTVFTCSSVYKIIIETCFYTITDIGKYRLSAVPAILISDIGIGQNMNEYSKIKTFNFLLLSIVRHN